MAGKAGGSFCRVCLQFFCKVDHDDWPCSKCCRVLSKEHFRLVKGRRTAYCKDCSREATRKTYLKRREYYNSKNREYKLWSIHRIRPQDYQLLLDSQGGRCAICRCLPGTKGRGEFNVDHDHSCCPSLPCCGKCIRGLLCSLCNVAIGQCFENPEILRRAAAYVENGGKIEMP